MELVKDMVQSKFNWNETADKCSSDFHVKKAKENFENTRIAMSELPLKFIWKWNSAEQ